MHRREFSNTYYELVEKAFVNNKKRGLFMSPSDWLMVEWFRQEGIPVDIVIKGINEMARQKGYISSLKASKKYVYRVWEVEREIRVGEYKGAQNEDIRDEVKSRLAAVADYLAFLARRAKNDTLVRDFVCHFSKEISGIMDDLKCDKEIKIDQIEEKLRQKESDLAQLLFDQLDEESKVKIKKMVECFYKSVEKEFLPEQKDRMFKIIWLKCVRDFFEMPRFSVI